MKDHANLRPSVSILDRADAARAEAARLCDEIISSCQALQRTRQLLRDIQADEESRQDGAHRLKPGVGR
jgi:hypothetical protein